MALGKGQDPLFDRKETDLGRKQASNIPNGELRRYLSKAPNFGLLSGVQLPNPGKFKMEFLVFAPNSRMVSLKIWTSGIAWLSDEMGKLAEVNT